VYVGRLRSGEDVAIKVQKPGVEDTLKVRIITIY
jgi:predicted unusual protein kinase regulating ubiquinone biosynthesis (AarF/ABC1/UbiB family)